MYKSINLCKPSLSRLFSLFLIPMLTIVCFSFQPVYAEESSDTPITYSSNVVHHHTGNSRDGGGCYTAWTYETVEVEDPCKGHMVYYPEWDATQCDICGAGYSGDQSGRDCYTINYHYENRYTMTLGCGLSDNQVLGNLTVTKSNNDWSNDVVLSMNVSSSAFPSGTTFYINGNAIEGNTFTATENGTYTVSIPTNANTSCSPITVALSNIDNSAPEFTLEYSSEPDLPYVTVEVIARDNDDGCGLHPLPYSFDGGNTWTDDPIYTVTDNTTVDVRVRDNMENEAEEELEITNIKLPDPPAVEETSSTADDSSYESDESSDNDYSYDNNESENNDAAQDITGVISSETKPNPGPKKDSKKKDTSKPADNSKEKKPAVVNKQVTAPKASAQNTTKKEELTKEEVKAKTTAPTAENTKETDKIQSNDGKLLKTLLLCIGSVLLTGMLVLLALFMGRICIISNMVEKDVYTFKGLTNISKRNGMYEINPDKDLLDKCDTGKLMIKLPPLFAASKIDEPLNVYLPGKQSYSVKIASKIYLSVKI